MFSQRKNFLCIYLFVFIEWNDILPIPSCQLCAISCVREFFLHRGWLSNWDIFNNYIILRWIIKIRINTNVVCECTFCWLIDVRVSKAFDQKLVGTYEAKSFVCRNATDFFCFWNVSGIFVGNDRSVLALEYVNTLMCWFLRFLLK